MAHNEQTISQLLAAAEVPASERERALAVGVAPINAGLAIMQTIRGYGVDIVFGIPGTHNLEFYRPLARLGIRAITTRHEQGAGYAADAWAQRTGLPGVVIATSGPGLLNTLSAIGTAYCESRPMLVLAPTAARAQLGRELGILHETKDQLGAAAAIAARAVRAESAVHAVETVHEAFALFRSGRPRPVYLEVPLDVLESVAIVDQALLLPREAPAAPPVDDAALAQAAAVLASAKKPVVIAGAGAREAADDVAMLAEALGAPIVTSSNGKGVVTESHPLVVGAELRLAATVQMLNEADVLLVVGTKLAAGEFAGGTFAPRGHVIRVDIDAAQTQRNLSADTVLHARSSDALAALRAQLARHCGVAEPRAAWVDLSDLRARILAEADGYGAGIGALAARIAAALPRDAVVTGDSSQICYAGVASHLRVQEAASYLNMVTYSTLGYGVPAAIGAKLASPDRPVVCVSGDGALMFSVQELQTASEQGLDLVVICVDNGGYGEIEQNECDRGISPIAVRLCQPDWPMLAAAFGGKGFAVTDAAELEECIAAALATRGVSLVHVPLALFA